VAVLDPGVTTEAAEAEAAGGRIAGAAIAGGVEGTFSAASRCLIAAIRLRRSEALVPELASSLCSRASSAVSAATAAAVAAGIAAGEWPAGRGIADTARSAPTTIPVADSAASSARLRRLTVVLLLSISRVAPCCRHRIET
jgi:hypothetical protein